MKRLIASGTVAALWLSATTPSYALFGGPFDRGNAFNLSTGTFEAIYQLPNGNGIVRFSETNNGHLSQYNTSTVFYRGIIYYGNAIGTVNMNGGYATGMSNGRAYGDNNNQDQSFFFSGTGGNIGICNANWTAEVVENGYNIRFEGEGVAHFFGQLDQNFTFGTGNFADGSTSNSTSNNASTNATTLNSGNTSTVTNASGATGGVTNQVNNTTNTTGGNGNGTTESTTVNESTPFDVGDLPSSTTTEIANTPMGVPGQDYTVTVTKNTYAPGVDPFNPGGAGPLGQVVTVTTFVGGVQVGDPVTTVNIEFQGFPASNTVTTTTINDNNNVASTDAVTTGNTNNSTFNNQNTNNITNGETNASTTNANNTTATTETSTDATAQVLTSLSTGGEDPVFEDVGHRVPFRVFGSRVSFATAAAIGETYNSTPPIVDDFDAPVAIENLAVDDNIFGTQ